MRAGYRQAVRSFWEGVLDLVYPPVCRICERWDRPPVCDDCYAAFLPIPEPVCKHLRTASDSQYRLRPLRGGECAGRMGLSIGARAAGVYFGPLREGIHQLKYRGAEELGPLLGAYLANRCVVEELLPTKPRFRRSHSRTAPSAPGAQTRLQSGRPACRAPRRCPQSPLADKSRGAHPVFAPAGRLIRGTAAQKPSPGPFHCSRPGSRRGQAITPRG